MERPRPAVIAFVADKPLVMHDEYQDAPLPVDLEGIDLPENLFVMPGWEWECKLYTEVRNKFIRFEESRLIGSFTGENPDVQYYDEQVHEPDNQSTRGVSRMIGVTDGGCPDCVVIHVSRHRESLGWIHQQDWIDVVVAGAATMVDAKFRGRSVGVEAIVDTGRPYFVPHVGNLVDTYQDEHNEPAIKVGGTNASGSYRTPAALVPDLSSSGAGVVALADGRTYESSGNSFDGAPYLAALYARFLMTGWEEGWLERVVENGTVRHLIDAESPLHDRFDGALDGRDVLGLLALTATHEYGVADRSWDPVAPIAYESDPSVFVGHGVFLDQELAHLLEFARPGLEGEVTGPGVSEAWRSERTAREGLSTAYDTQWSTVCAAGLPGNGVYDCEWDRWLYEDDWYE